MATQYDVSFLNAANRILDKFGVPATLALKTEGSYDPLTSQVTNTETSVSISKASPPIRYEKSEIDNSLIKVGDFKVIIAREDDISDVSIDDEITINGITAIIKNVDPVYSGAEVAIYILQCRKG